MKPPLPSHKPAGVGPRSELESLLAPSLPAAVQTLGTAQPSLPHHTINSEKSYLWFGWPLPHPLAGLSWPLSSCFGAQVGGGGVKGTKAKT